MKLLAISDTHIAPKLGRRKDDVAVSIMGKWEAAISIAMSHYCDGIIHCGDVFDRPTVPRMLEQYLRETLACGCIEHAVCLGTHDMGKGAELFAGKSATSLRHSTFVASVSGWAEGFWNRDDTSIWMVAPQHEWPVASSEHVPPWSLRADGAPIPQIIAAHKMIVPEYVPWGHLLVTDIDTDADIVISGDYHVGFDPIIHDDTWFCGVGALTRTFREQHDLTRHPRCVLIDTDLLPGNPFTLIPLPDHVVKPVEEVYDAETRSVEDHRDDLRTTVSDALRRAKQRETASWDESIRTLLDHPAAFEEATGVSAKEGAERLRDLCTAIEGEQ